MSESLSHQVSITRTTSTDADGVTRTEVHITEVHGGSPDGSVLSDATARVAKAHGCGGHECDCFDVESACDEREKAMIAALRAYLRPEQAPDCLMTRLQAVLDRCCKQ